MWRLYASLLLAVLVPSLAAARTWYVLPDGSGDAPTIQAAIDSADAGDIVELADGTFTGDGNYDLDYVGETITVRSQSGEPELCIIDCEGSPGNPHRGFHFHSGETSGAVVEGLTITNGYQPTDVYGGAIYITSASPTLTNCIFTGNHADWGGAISCEYCYSAISDCIFSGNTAGGAGGLDCGVSSSPTVTNCVFAGNSAQGAAGGMAAWDGCYPIVTNCIFENNEADISGGFHSFAFISASQTLSGCTFLGNSAVSAGGGMGVWGASPSVTSCTFSGNAAPEGGGLYVFGASASVTLENSIVAFSTAGEGVYSGSVGNVTLTCCDLFDNAGGDWVGNIADQSGSAGNIGADPLFCGGVHSESPYTLWDDSPCAPDYNPGCGLIGAWPVYCVRTIVTPDGTGDYPTIQAAVDGVGGKTRSVDVIELAAGTYTGEGNRDISFRGKAIIIRTHGRVRQGAIIDCQGLGRGFVFKTGEGPGSVLDGVTIIGGNKGFGGAILCSTGTSPTILDCMLAGNAAQTAGGGICCGANAAPTVSECTFDSNSANVGGGVSCGSNSSPALTSCTFVGHSAPSGGVIHSLSILPALANTIIAFSTQGVAVAGSAITLTCCDLYGNAGGDWVGPIAGQFGINGNFSADPCFCDADNGDYHLWNYSPCNQVGCGLIGAWPVGCTDPQAAEAEPDPQVLWASLSPNPVSRIARIRYVLPTGAEQSARLTIYDPAGRVVRTLMSDGQATGTLTWNGTDALGHRVPAGAYFLRLSVGEEKVVRRVVVVR
ncbi:MAG: T9SS type A sorting domain-containing protein [Candidatus Eisenbacteria sp.]|nr:T9SS type A sorting domain-containing protein [Candidatus Eisenbacteria bacterium]